LGPLGLFSIILLLFVRIDLALIQMAVLGVSLPLALFIVIAWGSFWTIIIYCKFTPFIDRIVKKIIARQKNGTIERSPVIRALYRTIQSFKEAGQTIIRQRNQKILAWFLRNNKFFIFLIYFLPFTFGLDNLAVMAARLSRIRYALPIFLALGALRVIWIAHYIF